MFFQGWSLVRWYKTGFLCLLLCPYRNGRYREQVCKWRRVKFSLVSHRERTFVRRIQKDPMQSVEKFGFCTPQIEAGFFPASKIQLCIRQNLSPRRKIISQLYMKCNSTGCSLHKMHLPVLQHGRCTVHYVG